MEKRILISVIAVLSIVLVSCGTRKTAIKNADSKVVVVPNVPIADTLKTENKLNDIELLQATNFKFSNLALKGKARLNINGKENDVNLTIRIKEQEKIWVSVSAIIGEVARVLITPDSIQIINRLDAVYTKKPFSFIHDYTNKEINFSVLQSILTGNSIDEFISNKSELSATQSTYVISGALEELLYSFTFNTLKRLEKTEINDVSADQFLNVQYSKHQVYNGLMFPGNIQINSEAEKNIIGVQVAFSSIEGNVPLEFPFTIPSRYKVIN